jgi:hypothetical protein
MSRRLSCAAIRPGSRGGVVTGTGLCFALARWLVLAHVEAEDIAGKGRRPCRGLRRQVLTICPPYSHADSDKQVTCGKGGTESEPDGDHLPFTAARCAPRCESYERFDGSCTQDTGNLGFTTRCEQ